VIDAFFSFAQAEQKREAEELISKGDDAAIATAELAMIIYSEQGKEDKLRMATSIWKICYKYQTQK